MGYLNLLVFSILLLLNIFPIVQSQQLSELGQIGQFRTISNGVTGRILNYTATFCHPEIWDYSKFALNSALTQGLNSTSLDPPSGIGVLGEYCAMLTIIF